MRGEEAQFADAGELVVWPAFVRRVAIPMLYGVGRVLGKHEKYKDAPKPMTKGPVPATR